MALNKRILFAAAGTSLGLFMGFAHADVLSDRYRGYGFYWNGGGGNTRILEDLSLPHYQNENNLVASPSGGVLPTPWASNDPLISLRALVETPDTYVPGRSGSDPQLNWPINGAVLCHPQNNTQTGTAEPCASRVMGQASYTVLYFPVAGQYNLLASHDDDIEIAFTPEVGAADYRSQTYTTQASLPFNCGPSVPGSSPDCISDTGQPIDRKAPLLTIDVAEDNTCQPIRLLWNNWGSDSQLRIYWNGPGTTGTELIPAGNLLNPSQPYENMCPKRSTGNTITPVPTLHLGGLVGLSAMVAAITLWRRRRAVSVVVKF